MAKTREQLLKDRLQQLQLEESFGSKIMRGPKNAASAMAKFGHKLLNFPSNHLESMGSHGAAEMLKFRPGYDYDQALGLPKEKGWSDMLVQSAPEIAGAFAVPEANLGKLGGVINKIPAAGKYINKILSEGLPQMVYAAAMSDPGQEGEAALTAGATGAPFSAIAEYARSPMPARQRILSGIIGGGAGTLAGYLGGHMGLPDPLSTGLGIATGLFGNKLAGTKGMMMEEQAGGKNIQKAQERLKMAKRLNLDFLTPEEAFNSPFLARRQGRLGRTEEGSEMMYDKFQKRNESEQNAINRLMKQIHNPDVMGPEAERLYALAEENQLPQNYLDELNENEIIKDAKKDVLSKGAYREKLKEVPEESFKYWNQMKKALDDMIEGAPKEEASLIRGVKKSLLEQMDKISPDYKTARGLEEGKFVRQELESAFDKTNINSGHAFYKALNSKEDFEKLMHSLRNVPIARAKLKAMRELFKDFRKESTINKVRGLEQAGMKQNRNFGDWAINTFENMFTSGKFDKEAIEFITSKDWDKQLADINKISDKREKMAKTIEIFGKIASQANAKREPFMRTENYDIYE